MESRVESLERAVFGNDPDFDIAQALSSIQKAVSPAFSIDEIHSFIEQWEKVKSLLASLEAGGASGREELLLSSYDELLARLRDLSALAELKDAVATPSLRELQHNEAKLAPLAKVNLDQVAATEVLDERLSQLLEAYNANVADLAESFQLFDAKLKLLEK